MTWVATGFAGASFINGALQDDDADKKARRLQGVQQQAEYDRQNRIDTNIGLINQAFDKPGRQNEISNFMQALRGTYGQDVREQHSDTGRKLKFALARSGLTGGSQAIDSKRRLGQEFEDALLDVEGRVETEGQKLRQQDEASRVSLIGQARAGADATTSLRRSSSALTSNLNDATSRATTANLGDLFQQTAGTYKRQEERQARRSGFGYTANRADLYGRAS